MNIDNMTYGELKQIAALFSNTNQSEVQQSNPVIGMVCVARCYSAGVHVGEVQSVDGENVILKNSVRLWNWKAEDGIALSGVAQNGIKRSETKIDTQNPLLYLTGVCELIPCSGKSIKSIFQS